jgi:hypothetical protein
LNIHNLFARLASHVDDGFAEETLLNRGIGAIALRIALLNERNPSKMRGMIATLFRKKK